MLSVLWDDKDKSLLRLVDVGPIYVSPDYEMGIDDAIKFFPHDFDEADGEVKTWLAQQSARDEEAIAAEELNALLGEAVDGELLPEEEEEEEHVAAEEQRRQSTVAAIG